MPGRSRQFFSGPGQETPGPVLLKFEISGSVDIVIFMDVPAGFAPAIVATSRTISLKEVVTRV
jgi:hypothetical protein